MGSALSWAVYCAFLRIKPREVKGNAFVAVSALLGAIVLIPVLALELIRNGMPGWNSYANTGVVTGLAYLCYFSFIGCHIYYGTKGLAPLAQRVERSIHT